MLELANKQNFLKKQKKWCIHITNLKKMEIFITKKEMESHEKSIINL